MDLFGRTDDERAALHQLLKYGFDLIYWQEFVFKAYHHHTAEAIFLAGIPDLKSTLPHAWHGTVANERSLFP